MSKSTSTTSATSADVKATLKARALGTVVTALKAYARTPKQTFTVCAAVYRANSDGVSYRAMANDAGVKSLVTFGSSQIGHFGKAYARVIDAGVTVGDKDSATDSDYNVVARMSTAVSGGTTGVKTPVLDAMVESARERGLDAQALADELALEISGHALQTAHSAQSSDDDDAPSDDAPDNEDNAPSDALRAVTVVAFLERLAAGIVPGAFDASTLASIATLTENIAALTTVAIEAQALAVV